MVHTRIDGRITISGLSRLASTAAGSTDVVQACGQPSRGYAPRKTLSLEATFSVKAKRHGSPSPEFLWVRDAVYVFG